ncbi:hypothetical protein DRO61_05370 [Candidatus Bathyarchaeota archaeon]|nr:MAG: hypothetical protein DRO61_05370 [Candidatus Bathyarchaeota archaeon]
MVKFCVRRTTEGLDRASCAYLIEGASGFRFAKTAVSEAIEFGSRKQASSAMSRLKRSDVKRDVSTYSVCEIEEA